MRWAGLGTAPALWSGGEPQQGPASLLHFSSSLSLLFMLYSKNTSSRSLTPVSNETSAPPALSALSLMARSICRCVVRGCWKGVQHGFSPHYAKCARWCHSRAAGLAAHLDVKARHAGDHGCQAGQEAGWDAGLKLDLQGVCVLGTCRSCSWLEVKTKQEPETPLSLVLIPIPISRSPWDHARLLLHAHLRAAALGGRPGWVCAQGEPPLARGWRGLRPAAHTAVGAEVGGGCCSNCCRCCQRWWRGQACMRACMRVQVRLHACMRAQACSLLPHLQPCVHAFRGAYKHACTLRERARCVCCMEGRVHNVNGTQSTAPACSFKRFKASRRKHLPVVLASLATAASLAIAMGRRGMKAQGEAKCMPLGISGLSGLMVLYYVFNLATLPAVAPAVQHGAAPAGDSSSSKGGGEGGGGRRGKLRHA